MKKKILIGAALVAGLCTATVWAMGGMSWIDAMGLRGEKRLVASRIHGYWDARVAGDLERQAQFIHPLQGSIPDPGILITEDYKLTDVDVEGDRAIASLTVHSRLKHPILSSRDRTVELQSTWVKYEGQWYIAVSPTTVYDAIQYYRGEWSPPTVPADPSDQVSAVQ